MKNKIVTFEERLARGEYYDLATAAKISGYNAVYLRRLCHDQKVEVTRRRQNYYFTPRQLAALFVVIPAKGVRA